MAELMLPDIAGRFQSGYAFGNQMKHQRMADQDNAQLRGLAPQVIAGDPAALAQAAAIDPQAAAQYEDAGNRQLLKLRNFVNYVDEARKTGNVNAVNAALREAAPYISQMSGKPAPTEWTPDMDAGWEQLKAKVAMAGPSVGGNVQSVKIGADGYYYNVYRDGRIERTGVQANPSIQIMEQEGQLPYGVVRSGGVAGSIVPFGGGGAQPAPQGVDNGGGVQAGAGAYGVRVNIDGVAPGQAERLAQTVAMMRQSGYSDQEIDGWVQSQLSQPRQVPHFSGPPAGGGIGPVPVKTSAQKAAEQEAAKLGVQNANFGTQLQQETDLARAKAGVDVDKARQTAGVDTQAKLAQERPAAQAALNDATSNLERLAVQATRVLNHPGLEGITGIRGQIPDIPGSQAANARAELDSLKSQVGFGVLQAMRQASKTGGALGAISERENDLLQSNLAALQNSQSPESFRENLKRIIDYAHASEGRMKGAFEQQYGGLMNRPLEAGPAAPRTPPPGAVQTAINPQTGQRIELRNGQWVPAQ